MEGDNISNAIKEATEELELLYGKKAGLKNKILAASSELEFLKSRFLLESADMIGNDGKPKYSNAASRDAYVVEKVHDHKTKRELEDLQQDLNLVDSQVQHYEVKLRSLRAILEWEGKKIELYVIREKKTNKEELNNGENITEPRVPESVLGDHETITGSDIL